MGPTERLALSWGNARHFTVKSPGLAPVFASREMVEHEGSAPSTPAWKADVYLSTLMLEEMACQPKPG